MRSPWKWLKRRWELRKQEPRRLDVESQLRRELGLDLRLVPASVKGGYDEIYLAQSDNRCIAVVRVNSPYKTINDPIGKLDPGVPLGPRDRLDREWSAYSVLAPLGLSPVPLWRRDDAIACSWVSGERAADQLRQRPERLWDVLDRIIPSIARMHAAGMTHLDLNLGNILLESGGEGVSIIDFEFGPVEWVSPGQQRGYDYLRIIDDCLKPRRGGRVLQANLNRLAGLLCRHVDPAARQSDMRFSLAKLHRLAGEPQVLNALETVFPCFSAGEIRAAG